MVSKNMQYHKRNMGPPCSAPPDNALSECRGNPGDSIPISEFPRHCRYLRSQQALCVLPTNDGRRIMEILCFGAVFFLDTALGRSMIAMELISEYANGYETTNTTSCEEWTAVPAAGWEAVDRTYPFYAKQTQLSLVLAWERGFGWENKANSKPIWAGQARGPAPTNGMTGGRVVSIDVAARTL